jgi:chromosome partitioning protein
MQRILVLNAKGGCGKSTIATTLAGYFAHSGKATVLMDYDPQGSSMKWLSLRKAERPGIHGVSACEKRPGVTRTFQQRLPHQVDRLVIDAPAGTSGLQLVDFVRQADVVLMPVLPSPIDIHAAARFIQDLLLTAKLRQSGAKLGVIANRVRENTLVFKDLEKFLNTLNLPLVATLRDSQNYIRAAEQGLAIHELEARRAKQDEERWSALVTWLDKCAEQPDSRPVVRQDIQRAGEFRTPPTSTGF